MNIIKPIAIYLPQFHPIPENDEWWGKGFTEWTNVVKAKPRFEGHYQPHLPADLGFYDLRLEEARLAQEALAKQYGIYGFCYYHYWFNEKRLLHEPLDRKLKNPKEDLPFMLCWANENWTRAWDGGQNHILLEQKYNSIDDLKHIQFLVEIFKDERYIKVNGKPVFAIYKPDLFPDIKNTIRLFREEALRHGLELYLCWFERWIGWTGDEDEVSLFDAAIEFQPLSRSQKYYKKHLKEKELNVANTLPNRIKNKTLSFLNTKNKNFVNKDLIIDYKAFTDFDIQFNKDKRRYNCYPGVCPSWDNSSRRQDNNATIFLNSNPNIFGNWYNSKLKQFIPFSESENFIFINAWNEWAEGNHLEPCQKWGKQYLEKIKKSDT